LRTAYLGSSAFAVEVLNALATSPHRPALVVTPPDRPRGRGRKLGAPPVAHAARELGLELHQTANVNDEETLDAIARAAPEAIAVCEFGQIIGEPLLSRYLMLNVHPSLVPRWRGAAPIERALMAGDSETGVMLFRVVPELDAGPVALSRREPIHPDDTYGTLAARLARIGGELLIDGLTRAEAGTLQFEEQDGAGITYAHKIEPRERCLDPGRPAAELARAVRALTPHVGAYVELPGGERLGVVAARAVEDELAPGLSPGDVRAEDGRLLVGSANGALELLEVRPPGGRTMPAADYLRGHGRTRT
jgi:methionyl-tRNA formyltransferase